MVTRTKKVFVGGLSAPTTIDDVKNYFQQFGRVSFFSIFISLFFHISHCVCNPVLVVCVFSDFSIHIYATECSISFNYVFFVSSQQFSNPEKNGTFLVVVVDVKRWFWSTFEWCEYSKMWKQKFLNEILLTKTFPCWIIWKMSKFDFYWKIQKSKNQSKIIGHKPTIKRSYKHKHFFTSEFK